MTAGEIASYLSLVLAVVFWVMSTKQANDAKKTLNEIKSEIITWQAQLNKAAIDIISSRPEVIAKETEQQEAKSLSEFSTQLSGLIKTVSSVQPASDAASAHHLQVLEKLLTHHKALILGKQQIMAQVIAQQQGIKQPLKTETKQEKGNEQ